MYLTTGITQPWRKKNKENKRKETTWKTLGVWF